MQRGGDKAQAWRAVRKPMARSAARRGLGTEWKGVAFQAQVPAGAPDPAWALGTLRGNEGAACQSLSGAPALRSPWAHVSVSSGRFLLSGTWKELGSI